jgi:hypothetical protein
MIIKSPQSFLPGHPPLKKGKAIKRKTFNRFDVDGFRISYLKL